MLFHIPIATFYHQSFGDGCTPPVKQVAEIRKRTQSASSQERVAVRIVGLCPQVVFLHWNCDRLIENPWTTWSLLPGVNHYGVLQT